MFPIRNFKKRKYSLRKRNIKRKYKKSKRLIKKRKNKTKGNRKYRNIKGGARQFDCIVCNKVTHLRVGDTYYTRKNGQPGTMCANCASTIIKEYIELFGNDGAMTGSIALGYKGWEQQSLKGTDTERKARAQVAAEKEECRRVLWEEGRPEREKQMKIEREVAEADGSTKSG